jgi:hypothetical protein
MYKQIPKDRDSSWMEPCLGKHGRTYEEAYEGSAKSFID